MPRVEVQPTNTNMEFARRIFGPDADTVNGRKRGFSKTFVVTGWRYVRERLGFREDIPELNSYSYPVSVVPS